MNAPENPDSEENHDTDPNPANMGHWPAPPPGRLHRLPIMRRQPVGHCNYCGAPLSGHLFFCQVCGKPYREAPGSKMLPVPLSDKERIEEKAPSFWPVFWAFASALFVSVFLGIIFFGFEREYQLYQLVLQTFALLGVTLFLGAKHFSLLQVQFKQPGFDRSEAWFGLMALVPLLALNWFWQKQQSMLNEQRRLREQLRQERLRNQSFQQYTAARLDVHDQALSLDTRSADAPRLELDDPHAPRRDDEQT